MKYDDIIVQVDGVTLQHISVPHGINKKDLKAMILESDDFKESIKKPIKKIIYIPEILVNIVTNNGPRIIKRDRKKK